MSEDRVIKKTKHRTKQQWREIVANFEQSNLSQSTYCRQHNIPTSTFSKWRTQFSSSTAIKAHLSPSLTLE